MTTTGRRRRAPNCRVENLYAVYSFPARFLRPGSIPCATAKSSVISVGQMATSWQKSSNGVLSPRRRPAFGWHVVRGTEPGLVAPARRQFGVRQLLAAVTTVAVWLGLLRLSMPFLSWKELDPAGFAWFIPEALRAQPLPPLSRRVTDRR